MDKPIPSSTVQVFARSIFKEASTYGFKQVDIIRLVNELLDSCSVHDAWEQAPHAGGGVESLTGGGSCLPLSGDRLSIRAFDMNSDIAVLKEWLPDKYGRFFALSCATAQSVSIDTLVSEPRNHFGVITTLEGKPIGVLAYLDHNREQKRAELRKLIGDPDSRGKGLAEEATRLWIAYGLNALALDKIYVSTLQTNISNIKLNENIGFRVEGLLRNEVLIDGERHDVLRMGICRD